MALTPNKLKQYVTDPVAFRNDLLIEVDKQVKQLGEEIDPWQAKDFEALDPALKVAAGRATLTADTKMRGYLERPRGHSKTSDLAVMACWAIAFASSPIRGYCYAADRDQAKLLHDSCSILIRLNPLLSEILSVEAGRIVNTSSGPGKDGSLTFEASDVGSSFGIRPDLIIIDELTHWPENKGELLWESLISSAEKRSCCALIIIANAGWQETFQWRIREEVRTDADWYFSRLDGPRASWFTEGRLERARRMLPEIAFRRQWLNEWAGAGGDALRPEDIAAAFDPSLKPMTGTRDELHDYHFVTGVDLGLTRDGSAVVTLAFPKGGRAGDVWLADHKLWRPINGNKINLIEVEKYILQLDRIFGLESVALDNWQAELLAQRLEADTSHRQRNGFRTHFSQPWVQTAPPIGSNLQTQASLTIEYFQDHKFHFFPCEPLRRDLLKVRAEERSYGFRLVSPRDGEGHGDSFSAFALALAAGHELGTKKQHVVRSFLTDDGETPWEAEWRRIQEAHAEEQELLKTKELPDEPKTIREIWQHQINAEMFSSLNLFN